jgi:hypothetical protein
VKLYGFKDVIKVLVLAGTGIASHDKKYVVEFLSPLLKTRNTYHCTKKRKSYAYVFKSHSQIYGVCMKCEDEPVFDHVPFLNTFYFM